jgi:hypothetical protein
MTPDPYIVPESRITTAKYFTDFPCEGGRPNFVISLSLYIPPELKPPVPEQGVSEDTDSIDRRVSD